MILMDTGPVVALCDPRVRLHRTALGHLKKLAPATLHLCEAVFVEACFHLPHQRQRERLRALIAELRIDAFSTEDSDFQDEVFAWLIKYGEHEPDWADGCLAVMSEAEPRLKVWTYDSEFRSIWRRPDGRSIPMAVR